LLRWRCGLELPDDDAGREYLYELLLPVSLGPEPDLKMANIIETWADWMNVDERFYLTAQIERTPASVRKIKATTLGERLRVTNAEREHLRLWTIAPFDMTSKQLKEQRKAKDRARKAQLRQAAGGKPREQSLSRAKPWAALGISRATYYRRRETNSSEVKLLISRGRNCLTEQAARPPEVAEEVMSEAQNKPKSTEKQHGHEPLARPPVLRTNLSHRLNGYGAVRMQVTIREIRHSAIKSGPDDDLDDFKIEARMTGFP